MQKAYLRNKVTFFLRRDRRRDGFIDILAKFNIVVSRDAVINEPRIFMQLHVFTNLLTKWNPNTHLFHTLTL